MSQTGLLFIIVGPTAAGKNALMNDALAHFKWLRQMPTATTRSRRDNETPGRERLFITPEDFQQMIADDALLEWQEVHPDRYYGVPRHNLEKALNNGEYLIADIDVLGATYIRSAYPDNVVLIFVKPASLQELARRMATRGDTQDDIQSRLKRVSMEMAYEPVADHIVVNDDFEQATQRFRSIIGTYFERDATAHHQFRHSIVTIPIYQNETLYRDDPPHYPADTLRAREIPHDAALRSLKETFGFTPSVDHLLRIKPNKGSFISPVQVQVHEEGSTRHITFTYVYLLPERISTTPDWEWRPAETLTLPDAAIQILREMS